MHYPWTNNAKKNVVQLISESRGCFLSTLKDKPAQRIVKYAKPNWLLLSIHSPASFVHRKWPSPWPCGKSDLSMVVMLVPFPSQGSSGLLKRAVKSAGTVGRDSLLLLDIDISGSATMNGHCKWLYPFCDSEGNRLRINVNWQSGKKESEAPTFLDPLNLPTLNVHHLQAFCYVK